MFPSAHLSNDPKLELNLLLKAERLASREAFSYLWMLDKLVDASLIIAKLRLPGLRAQQFCPLPHLNCQVD